jgi:DNA-binding FadR family transcriptional regulator
MRQVARTSLVESAIAQIRDEVGSGTWPVGHRLPAEPRLAEQLGMSRAPVREAIRALVHSGILVVRQGAGTYVRAVRESDAALLKRLDAAEVADVIEVRRGLDVAAARGAALRRTDTDLVAMADALERRRQAVFDEDDPGFVRADIDFHVGVAAATHNHFLLEIYGSFAEAIGSTVGLAIRENPPGQGLAPHHDNLLEAIRRQDPEAAVQAALANLDSHEAQIRKMGPSKT